MRVLRKYPVPGRDGTIVPRIVVPSYGENRGQETDTRENGKGSQ